MNWFTDLFTQPTVANSVLILSLVIAAGMALQLIRFRGISLGVTWILFVGILLGQLGISIDPHVSHFAKEFGLILFIYSIGLEVGPGFFRSLKSGGIMLNGLALLAILLGCLITVLIIKLSGEPSQAMIGALYGAVTNTPGLGAATEALNNVFNGDIPQIASGYACAYPLGVLGIIGATIAVRYLCNIHLEREEFRLQQLEEANATIKPCRLKLEVNNKYLDGKTIMQVHKFLNRDFVCTRLLHDGHVSIPNKDTILHLGDKMFIVTSEANAEAIIAFIGPEVEIDWDHQDLPLVNKRILITQPSINGKTLGSMHFSSVYGVNVTRVTRQGMDIFASVGLPLQVGDRIMVVGPEDAVNRVAEKMGNSIRRLDTPNIATIFIGIIIGIICGSLPLYISGMPVPLKLGIAGGPLIVAILIGRYGYKIHLVTYTTTSANMMLREIGLVLFLASVGIKAGANFVETVIQGNGLLYVLTGFLITIIPILIIGPIARLRFHLNYFTIMGMIAGTYTDPPALAYANSICSKGAPVVGYSTVYPLSMFLRIFTAQILIVLCCNF